MATRTRKQTPVPESAVVRHADRLSALVKQQSGELIRLRKELSETADKLSTYRDIDRAVNVLAAQRVKRDKTRPRPPKVYATPQQLRFGAAPVREEVQDEKRCTTHPQALREILGSMEEIVDQLGGFDELVNEEVRERIDETTPLLEDRQKMLDLLGMDEWDWAALAWKL